MAGFGACLHCRLPSGFRRQDYLHRAQLQHAAAAGYSYRLVLHDPGAGTWTPLPPLPSGGGGLPLFCQLAAVGEGPSTKLVVLGGWDPETWAPTAAVHVYDFLAGVWRRGVDMPPPRRSFFACAAVGGRVFVARERDEARGVRAAGGRFVALGGYSTEAQGRFTGSAEAFDPSTWSWGPVRERVIEDGACPRVAEERSRRARWQTSEAPVP